MGNFDMATISVKIDDVEVRKKLNSLTNGIKDYRQPFKKIDKQLTNIYSRKVFDTQGGAIGTKWKPLSAATLMMREKRQGYYSKPPRATNKMLVWTGKMQDSFRSQITKTRLLIKNVDKKFKYNQSNRPMLGINKNIISIVVDEIHNYAISLMRKK